MNFRSGNGNGNGNGHGVNDDAVVHASDLPEIAQIAEEETKEFLDPAEQQERDRFDAYLQRCFTEGERLHQHSGKRLILQNIEITYPRMVAVKDYMDPANRAYKERVGRSLEHDLMKQAYVSGDGGALTFNLDRMVEDGHNRIHAVLKTKATIVTDLQFGLVPGVKKGHAGEKAWTLAERLRKLLGGTSSYDTHLLSAARTLLQYDETTGVVGHKWVPDDDILDLTFQNYELWTGYVKALKKSNDCPVPLAVMLVAHILFSEFDAKLSLDYLHKIDTGFGIANGSDPVNRIRAALMSNRYIGRNNGSSKKAMQIRILCAGWNLLRDGVKTVKKFRLPDTFEQPK